MEDRIPTAHRKTYDAVFRHPAPEDLEWKALRGLLASVSKQTSETNGNVRLARRGRMLTLQPDRHKGRATPDQIVQVRRFLEGPTTDHAAAAAAGAHLAVVLTARDGRVYRVLPRDAEPQRVEPYDPKGAGRTLHYLQDAPGSAPKPDRESFHEAIARTLRGAERILVFGCGNGAKGAVDQMLAYLKSRHSDLSHLVGGSGLVGEHPTPAELLAKAKEFHVKVARVAEPVAAEPTPAELAPEARAAEPGAAAPSTDSLTSAA